MIALSVTDSPVVDLFRSFDVTGIGQEVAELRCLAKECQWRQVMPGATTLRWLVTRASWHVEHSHRRVKA